MLLNRTQQRIYFLDYLRGFMVALVVLDHSMHAYSQHFGEVFFFQDLERSLFIDVLHMHNDAIMMPFMFFLAGIFILPSLQRRGYIDYLRERIVRLIIPFVLGILFITPFMKFHKSIIREGLTTNFLDFWLNHYITWQDTPFENLSQGGFWFIYLLFVLTIGALIIQALIPQFFKLVGSGVRWCFTRPIKGFIFIGILLALILTLSDLTWGAPWWIGFKPVFHVRGARFIVKILFFILGIGVSQSGLLNDEPYLNKLSNSWCLWLSLSLCIMGSYIFIALTYFHDGAYNNEFMRYVSKVDSTWFDEQAITLLKDRSLLVVLRTTLLGFTMLSLSVMYLSLFRKFLDKTKPLWQSLAISSYGIYIFHEPITTGSQLWLYGLDIDPIIKFVIVAAISLSLSWVVVDKILLRLPGFKRVL